MTRRGAGESDRPETGYDLGTLTEDLKILLDRLELPTAILVGGVARFSRYSVDLALTRARRMNHEIACERGYAPHGCA